MTQYAFNGLLFSQRQTGVMRYTKEILKELDMMVKPGEFKLIVPEYATYIPKLKNIEIVRCGKIKGSLWEQTCFPFYLKKNKLKGLNFNNTFPLICPGSIFIHDIAYKLHPEFGTTLHGKISNIYHRAVFRMAALLKMPIMTVSHFSKYQLIDEYKIAPERITVIGDAWQHFDNIDTDDSILTDYGLENKKYYYSLGSLSKMKNTSWVFKAAKKNLNDIFVLAGAKSMADNETYDISSNVKILGYVSDEQIKSLIKHCKAFIYPSIYDGFGLPPLEALSQGVPVICSNAACLPEIYGNSVHYIDPYDTDVDLDNILSQYIDKPEAVLKKYSWKKSAEQLYELLKK